MNGIKKGQALGGCLAKELRCNHQIALALYNILRQCSTMTAGGEK
jgi:hypothetical protein